MSQLTAEDRLFADLAALEIVWQLVEHQAVFTVEESAMLDREIPGTHTKNLFLKDSGGRYWLVTVPAQMRVDLKQLPAAIGCKRVSFGNAQDMERLLAITPGSVTPLAAINDVDRAVTVVIDAGLFEAERINVHPLRNSATIGLSPTELQVLLEHWNHQPVIAAIPTAS
jgi:Ala-tRNA(Pro) deacylase